MNQELENRVMASIKLSDAQQEAKEIRINFFNKFSDAINKYGNEICWVGFGKVVAANPKPENMAEADYEGTMITLKKKTRSKIAEILTETRKTTAPAPAPSTTEYKQRTPQASPNKPASHKQRQLMRQLTRRLEQISMFDSFTGSPQKIAGEYMELEGKENLSSREASDAISDMLGLIDDEM